MNKEKKDVTKTRTAYVLFERTAKNKRVLTVGMLSNRIDSYNTIIVPDGNQTPLEGVVVDYNHNRISTGAKIIKDLGVQEMTIQINGKDETIESRIVEIEVPDTAKAWTKENKENKPDQVNNLVELIDNGRISWVSVDFNPVAKDIETVIDSNGNTKRTIYPKWTLNYLSLLDQKAGQDDSFILDVRFVRFADDNLNLNNNTMGNKVREDETKVDEVVEETTPTEVVDEKESTEETNEVVETKGEAEATPDSKEVSTPENLDVLNSLSDIGDKINTMVTAQSEMQKGLEVLAERVVSIEKKDAEPKDEKDESDVAKLEKRNKELETRLAQSQRLAPTSAVTDATEDGVDPIAKDQTRAVDADDGARVNAISMASKARLG